MKPFLRLLAASGVMTALIGQMSNAQAQSRVWGTYYGGSKADRVHAIVTKGMMTGFVYVVGGTTSSDGIATADAFDNVKAQSGKYSGYLAKFDSSGKRIWGTYYGDEIPEINTLQPEAELIDVKLDSLGNVYVMGNILCPSQGLATQDAFQEECKGKTDLYLAKFSPSGERIWGTYFGGNADEFASSMVVTSSGVYAVGETNSASGIAMPSSADASLGGDDPSTGNDKDGFIVKFDLSGNGLWSRYYGGELLDRIFDIACRSRVIAADGSVQDDCAIVGDTRSATEIASIDAHDVEIASNDANDLADQAHDAFVARINGKDGQRVWGTYYGTDVPDMAISVVVNGNLEIYVGGWTNSKDGLATPGAFKEYAFAESNNFIAKFDENGHLSKGTYFGEDFSESSNVVRDLASDSAGNVYVLGIIDQTDNGVGTQATANAFDKVIESREATITKFDKSLNRLWATYYGGGGDELTENFSPSFLLEGGIAISSSNNVYVAGDTTSPFGMATAGAHKVVKQEHDGFIVKFSQSVLGNP